MEKNVKSPAHLVKINKPGSRSVIWKKGVTSLTPFSGSLHFWITNFVLNTTVKGSSFYLFSTTSYGQLYEPSNMVFIWKWKLQTRLSRICVFAVMPFFQIRPHLLAREMRFLPREMRFFDYTCVSLVKCFLF
jgi:hypothetical protein